MSLNEVGRLLLGIGLILVAIGACLLIISRIPGLNRFGRLPGDIHIEGENFACFAPIVSMILLSIILTIILNIVIRLFGR